MDQNKPLYSQLPHPDDIRIVVLHPGSADADLTGNLEIVRLTSKPAYEALSYVWGKDEPDGSLYIVCDGVRVPIRKNLHFALRRLRSENEPRALWIDTLCINQADLDERSSQVVKMGDIYRTAVCDLFYPGAPEPWMGSAMAMIRVIINRLGRWFQNEDNIQERIKEMSSEEAEGVFDLPAQDDGRWEALRLYFAMPCFRRVWILQEVCKATKVAVVLNTGLLDWDHDWQAYLESLNQAIFFRNSRLLGTTRQLFVGEELAYSWRMLALRSRARQEPEHWELSLLNLLDMARSCQATDPRDRIYALLNIAHDGPAIIARPDYSLPVREVFMATARALICHRKKLDVLNQVEMLKHEHTLPSWTADWRAGQLATYSGPMERSFPEGEELYSATRTSTAQINDIGDPAKLAVRGIIVDRIETLASGPAAAMIDVEKENYVGHGLWWMRAQRVAEIRGVRKAVDHDGDVIELPRKHYKHTEEDIDLALARTRVANLSSMSRVYRRSYFGDNEIKTVTEDEDAEPSWPALSRWLLMRTCYRNFFTGHEKYMGLVPMTADLGDVLVLLPGGDTPFVLRPTGTGEYLYVGDAYVHGIMNGELYSESMNTEEFIIR